MKYFSSFDLDGEVIYAKDLSGIEVNVKYPPYDIDGAVGDGTKNDTVAIQNCINYVSEHGGGTVFFPSGKYLTDSLTLKSGVTLFGFDRYSTKIVLNGGATNPLLLLNGENVGVYNLTLDGNSGVQVNDVNVITIIGNDVLLSDLIIKDGYKLLVYNGTGGSLQASHIHFMDAINQHCFITGNGVVQMNDVTFNGLGRLGKNVIEIDCDNGVYNFTSLAECDKCCVVSGNSNRIDCVAINSVTPVSDTGLYNNIDVWGNDKKAYFAKDVDETVKGSKGVQVDGSMSVNVGGVYSDVTNGDKNVGVEGNKTEQVKGLNNETNLAGKIINVTGKYVENINGDKETTANNIVENLTNKTVKGEQVFVDTIKPLKYGQVKEINNKKTVKMVDVNDSEYYLGVIDVNEPEKLHFPTTTFNAKIIHTYISKSTDTYKFFQGGTFVNGYLYIYKNNTENKGELLKINADTGEISSSKTININHGNDLTYDGVNIIAVDGTNIYYISTDTLSIVKTITLAENIKLVGCAFNNLNNKLYLLTADYGDYNFGFCEYDNEIKNHILLNIGNLTGINQATICFYKNHLYLPCSAPSATYVFDLNGNLLKIMDNPCYLEFGCTMENEFMCVNGDTIYMGWNTFTSPEQITALNLITVSNFVTNVTEKEQVIHNTYNANPVRTIYVDNSTELTTQLGTKQYPFKEISQAFCAYANCDDALYILVSDGDYELVYINRKNFELVGSGTVNCKGLWCVGASGLVNNINITENLGGNHTWVAGLRFERSVVSLSNVNYAKTNGISSVMGSVLSCGSITDIAGSYSVINRSKTFDGGVNDKAATVAMLGRCVLSAGNISDGGTLNTIYNNYGITTIRFNVNNNVHEEVFRSGAPLFSFFWCSNDTKYEVSIKGSIVDKTLTFKPTYYKYTPVTINEQKVMKQETFTPDIASFTVFGIL